MTARTYALVHMLIRNARVWPTDPPVTDLKITDLKITDLKITDVRITGGRVAECAPGLRTAPG